jgi:hypothetical protein
MTLGKTRQAENRRDGYLSLHSPTLGR